jgi:hypothetical protein
MFPQEHCGPEPSRTDLPFTLDIEGDVPAGTLWNFSVENTSMYLLLQ